MKFLEKEVLEVGAINWVQDSNGEYNFDYRGKIVIDNTTLAYCSQDGRCLTTLMYSFFYNDELKFNFMDQIKNSNVSYENNSHKNSESIIELHKNGFNVDEIIKMKKEGVI
jgi:hypothetical protein